MVGTPNLGVAAGRVVKSTGDMVTGAVLAKGAERVDAADRPVGVLLLAEAVDAPSGAMCGQQFCC